MYILIPALFNLTMWNSPLFSYPLYIWYVYTHPGVLSVSLSLEYQSSLNMGWISLAAATLSLIQDNIILIMHATGTCIPYDIDMLMLESFLPHIRYYQASILGTCVSTIRLVSL